MAIAINGSGTITGISQGGFNDNIITKNEMATGGAWAPAGTVLQVVQGTTINQFSTTSTTFVSTNLGASITPTSATSKILVCVYGSLRATQANYGAGLTILRNGTNICGAQGFGNWFMGASNYLMGASIGYLDSPSTASSVSYALAIKSESASYTSLSPANNGDTMTMILMEIAA